MCTGFHIIRIKNAVTITVGREPELVWDGTVEVAHMAIDRDIIFSVPVSAAGRWPSQPGVIKRLW